MFLTVLALAAVWGGLRPAGVYQHRAAVNEMHRLGVSTNVVKGGPDWLQNNVRFCSVDWCY